jgi:hypothetical protein
MTFAVFTAEPDATEYVSVCAKALGLPVPGIHRGKGPHVPMTDDPQSPGWTRDWSTPRRHETRTEWAVDVLPNPDRARLTTRERQVLDDATTVDEWERDR